jgi:hypothetical protein
MSRELQKHIRITQRRHAFLYKPTTSIHVLLVICELETCDFILMRSTILEPTTVAERSKARNIFACLNTGIVGSDSARGMDVCLRLFCVCVVLCR